LPIVYAGRGTKRGPCGPRFSFKFLTTGAEPKPKADGDKIVIGDQTVATEDGHIVLGKMAGPWDGPTAGAAMAAAAPD